MSVNNKRRISEVLGFARLVYGMIKGSNTEVQPFDVTPRGNLAIEVFDTNDNPVY